MVLSSSYSKPCALSVFLSLFQPPCVLSFSFPPTPAVSVFPSPSLGLWLRVDGAHGWSTCGSPSGSDTRFLASGGSGARLSSPLPLHFWLSLISFVACPPPSVSLPSQVPKISVSPETSAPSPDRLPAAGGPGFPFSCGRRRGKGGVGGGGRGRPPHLAPALPFPSSPVPLPTSMAL